jgi:hypothetical protein
MIRFNRSHPRRIAPSGVSVRRGSRGESCCSCSSPFWQWCRRRAGRPGRTASLPGPGPPPILRPCKPEPVAAIRLAGRRELPGRRPAKSSAQRGCPTASMVSAAWFPAGALPCASSSGPLAPPLLKRPGSDRLPFASRVVPQHLPEPEGPEADHARRLAAGRRSRAGDAGDTGKSSSRPIHVPSVPSRSPRAQEGVFSWSRVPSP